MKAAAVPKKFEFVLHNPENLILVDNDDERVVVRAVRNNFSGERKSAFIREIAAEGFIPDHLQNVADVDNPWSGVTWIIDGSWVAVGAAFGQKAMRQALRCVSAAALFWLALMGLLFAGAL